jgi:sporulation protein YlmC with PRC-barrel domain
MSKARKELTMKQSYSQPEHSLSVEGKSAAPQQALSPTNPRLVTYSQLHGHPLVDLSARKQVGEVHDLLLDADWHAIQGFLTKAGLFHGSSVVPTLKARIGIDAVTFHPGALEGQNTSWLNHLHKASTLLGMRVLSDAGQFLGVVSDLSFDRDTRSMLALTITPEQSDASHRLDSKRKMLLVGSVISIDAGLK